jgi:hypothetical protein
MSLTAGSHLGPYEILALIGEGGPTFADRGLRPQLRWVHRSPGEDLL